MINTLTCIRSHQDLRDLSAPATLIIERTTKDLHNHYQTLPAVPPFPQKSLGLFREVETCYAPVQLDVTLLLGVWELLVLPVRRYVQALCWTALAMSLADLTDLQIPAFPSYGEDLSYDGRSQRLVNVDVEVWVFWRIYGLGLHCG